MPTLAASATEAIAAGAPIIDLDATLIIEMGLFLVLWVFVGSKLVKPYLTARKERERLTVGEREEADRVSIRARTIFSEYEEKLSAARAEATSHRDELVTDGRSKAQELLADARRDAEAATDSAREELDDSMKKARKKIEPKAKELSVAIADKVLA